MITNSLAAAAAALLTASTTSAFLIPPEVSAADISAAEAIAATLAAPSIQVSQGASFPCPGCPVVFDLPDGGPRVTTPYLPNDLNIMFSVDNTPEGDKLLVNGVPVFPKAEGVPMSDQVVKFEKHFGGGPPPWARGGHHGGPPAWVKAGHHGGPPPWVKAGHRGGWAKHGPPKVVPQPLGFVMMAAGKRDAETGTELVTVSMRVNEIGGEVVRGLPEVRIELVKDGEKLVMVPRVWVIKTKECGTVLCRFMEKLFGPGKKGCHGAAVEAEEKPVVEVDGQQKERTFGGLMRSVATHILLPVVIGVVAGAAAGFLGVAVGTFIVFLWRTFVRRPSDRRHRRQHSRRQSQSQHKAAPKEAVVDEEKSGLMDHQDPPPSYEEGVKKVGDTEA